MDKDLEELIALVRSTVAEEEFYTIENFIKEHEIYPSDTNQIPLYKFQMLYNRWSPKKIGIVSIGKQLRKYFLVRNLGKTELASVWVDCEKAEEIKEQLWEKKALDRQEHNKRRQEARRKRKEAYQRKKEEARLKEGAN